MPPYSTKPADLQIRIYTATSVELNAYAIVRYIIRNLVIQCPIVTIRPFSKVISIFDSIIIPKIIKHRKCYLKRALRCFLFYSKSIYNDLRNNGKVIRKISSIIRIYTLLVNRSVIIGSDSITRYKNIVVYFFSIALCAVSVN